MKAKDIQENAKIIVEAICNSETAYLDLLSEDFVPGEMTLEDLDLDRRRESSLKNDEEAKKWLENFIKMYAQIQSEIEPLKKKSRKLQDTFAEKGYLSKEQIRLGKRVYTLLKSDLPVEDLPQAINLFISNKDMDGIQKLAEPSAEEEQPLEESSKDEDLHSEIELTKVK